MTVNTGNEEESSNNVEEDTSLTGLTGLETTKPEPEEDSEQTDSAEGSDSEPEQEQEATQEPVGSEDSDKESSEPESSQLVQNKDGSFTLGKFKAGSLEELLMQVEKSRANAEKLVGAPREDKGLFHNPFLEDANDDEYDEYDDVYTGESLADQIANRLSTQQQASQAPMQNDFVFEQQIKEYLDNPSLTTDDYKTLMGHILQNQPHNTRLRGEVLQRWSEVDPYNSNTVATQLAIADAQVQQEMLYQQQQEQYMQQQQLEQEHITQFQNATKAFADNHPDVSDYLTGIQSFFNSPDAQPLIQAAKGNASAMYKLYQSAYASAKLANPSAGNNEQVSNNTSSSRTSDVDLGRLEGGGESQSYNFNDSNIPVSLQDIFGNHLKTVDKG